jgi:hypothetical protein
MGFFNELDGFYVHIDHGMGGVVRLLVKVENLLHLSHDVGILFGWNHPAFLQVRFERVLFNTS